jgi:hypothetical protein
MKRVLLSICALALIVTSIGCATCNCNKCRQGPLARRNACGPAGCGPLAGRLNGGAGGPGGCRLGGAGGQHGCFQPYSGPQAAAVAYPYYTTRGPRDFLMNNPPSIGP